MNCWIAGEGPEYVPLSPTIFLSRLILAVFIVLGAAFVTGVVLLYGAAAASLL